MDEGLKNKAEAQDQEQDQAQDQEQEQEQERGLNEDELHLISGGVQTESDEIKNVEQDVELIRKF